MNQFRISPVLLFACSIGIVLFSCLEEIEDLDKLESTTFKPAIEFPLINSDFTMEEFLTEGESKARITELGGLMVLTYDDTIRTPTGDIFFVLPDQQSPVIAINGPDVSIPSPGASVTVNRSINFPISTSGGEQLDSIQVLSGSMVFDLTTNFPANISLTIAIPTLEIQGVPFQRTFTFNGPGNQAPVINLANSTFDLTANGTTTNRVVVNVTATITDTGQPINNTHRLECSFDLLDLEFLGLFGDLGTLSYPFSLDSIDVDIFGNAVTGTFELLSPSVQLDLVNSFGLPIGFNIQNFTAIKSDGSTLSLSGAAVSAPSNPYLLNAPTLAQIGQSVTSQVAINAGNSNLGQLISALPRYFSYRFGLQLNPGGTTENFVLNTSELAVGLHLELPFHGRFSRLTVTKDYEFSGLGIEDVFESKIKVKTTNETPLEAMVQVYFVDETGTVLDSLFTNRSILKGAAVDASGFTTNSAEVTTEVSVTQAKVDRIEQAERLLVVASLFTTNAGAVPVKFTTADKLRVNIGVNTKVEYKIK